MRGIVRSTTWITPSMVRLVLGGDELADLQMPDATDAYVNAAFPQPADDADVARRRYTVRRWDADTHELTLDFVTHGDEGVAGPWAQQAQPGDELDFKGPSGGYRPDPDADWHLLVGDESAVPAIAASLEQLPAGTRAIVRLLCDGPDHEVEVDSAADLNLVWLHRKKRADDVRLLVDELAHLRFPDGTVHAFVHGEADEIRLIRRHLLTERGLKRSDMSCSPYWRRTMTDEAWRTIKKDYVAAMEAETP